MGNLRDFLVRFSAANPAGFVDTLSTRHSLNYLWGKLSLSLVIVIFVVKLVKWLRVVPDRGRLCVFSCYGQSG